ncbi:hypothetical protein EXM22_04650 [Oceanispirochaeta crateris]|uniref:SMI1/KNR4 family protein n=1 Tax=Oceanispirochaeta crateris TaxID=2518645 RepID=A0A5C1QIB1_9SPIO|nr:SMI1/KNR4 family protein [Oceanispirochaeta crateris]QEN07311.1 hypothetical protein EXM22_04650 [Oceanispirochaeta crateris]
MNKSDILKIENNLKMKLPKFYKDTILNYPFERGSFAEEFMLLNKLETLLELNVDQKHLEEKFYIGSDGGEELYSIKYCDDSVYLYDLDLNEERLYTKDWKSFLDKIDMTIKEIKEDERLMKERKENKKWWQFWL